MGPNQRWLEVSPPGAHARILLYKATPEAPGAGSYEEARASIGKPTGMVLEVDEPKQQPCGWWGVFADQDGNTYGVHQ